MSITTSQEELFRMVSALDADALSSALPGLKPHHANRAIQRMWFLASDWQDIKSLDRLSDLAKANPVWTLEDPLRIVRSAIMLNRSESTTWWLDNLPEQDFLPALVSAVPSSAGSSPLDITKTLVMVAGKYPDALSSSQLMDNHLSFLDFPAKHKDSCSLSTLLSFVRPAQMIDYKKNPTQVSPTSRWWTMWAAKADLDHLNFWHGEISNSPSSMDFPSTQEAPTLFSLALIRSNPAIESIVSQPPSTPAYEAVGDVFSQLDTSREVLGGLVFSTPAKLARMLNKNPHFSELLLNARASDGSNLLHLLSRFRCQPKDSFNPSCLRWSRLEAWVGKHALHLLEVPDNSGQPPLAQIAMDHPRWYSSLSRELLMGISSAASRPASPPGSSPRL